jgi:hypothetical protein
MDKSQQNPPKKRIIHPFEYLDIIAVNITCKIMLQITTTARMNNLSRKRGVQIATSEAIIKHAKQIVKNAVGCKLT